MLAALGIANVRCVRKPTVAILSTGNEIVAHDETPPIGRVRDVNQLLLAAKIRRAGGEPIFGGIARDDANELETRTRDLVGRADALILSGGSSIGVRDLTAAILEAIGATLLFHGVDVRPGRPTIAAQFGDKPIFGMPGVPASASIIFDVFVRRVILRLGGETDPDPWISRRRARLSRTVPSVVGREDWVRVLLAGAVAEPLVGGQSSLGALVRADGMIVVPAASDGLAEGTEVEVVQ
jgi:molybdopterin molybdotransferase